MVGLKKKMKYGQKKGIFKMIKGMEKEEFERIGGMKRKK